jgi:flagellar protein FliS
MHQNNVSKHYKENAIFTMSPEELTLALYNGLVKFLMKAEEAILEKRYEEGNKNLVRAQEIIYEFVLTLDMNYPISNSLALMYDYMLRKIIEANVKKDSEMIAEVVQYAKELRDTWQSAMKIAKEENSTKNIKVAK